MNNLPCHLNVELHSGNWSKVFEVNATLNHIVDDLQAGKFELVSILQNFFVKGFRGQGANPEAIFLVVCNPSMNEL